MVTQLHMLRMQEWSHDSQRNLVCWDEKTMDFFLKKNSEAPEVILGKEYNCSCDVGEA